MDTIFIDELQCIGTHGVTVKEHRKPQRFAISLEVDVDDVGTAVATDNLEYVADYRVMRDIVEEVITGPHRNLVETLAAQIAERILTRFSVAEEVRVRLRKLHIWRNGQPGVLVRRRREQVQ